MYWQESYDKLRKAYEDEIERSAKLIKALTEIDSSCCDSLLPRIASEAIAEYNESALPRPFIGF